MVISIKKTVQGQTRSYCCVTVRDYEQAVRTLGVHFKVRNKKDEVNLKYSVKKKKKTHPLLEVPY